MSAIMSAINKWFPTPAKFWIVIFILLSMGIIYTFSQEYKDVKIIQGQISEINNHLDNMNDSMNTVKDTTKETRDITRSIHGKERVVIIHHHYYNHLRGPQNPIMDVLHNMFRGGR